MTTKNAAITINSELITLLGKKLYSNPLPVIVARELLQNAVDACRGNGGKVTVHINTIDNFIAVQDTGCGMDEDTLLNVFLQIGGSKKQTQDAVGRFGVAKVALFACFDWNVTTTCGTIEKSTMALDTTKALKKGTLIVATFPQNEHMYLGDIRKMLELNDTDVKITVIYNNDKAKHLRPVTGKHVNTIADNVELSLTRSTEDLTVYRIGGLVQFTAHRYDNSHYTALVDFTGIGYRPTNEAYPFSLSREDVNYEVRSKVTAYLTRFAKDKHTNEDHANSHRGRGQRKEDRGPIRRYTVYNGIRMCFDWGNQQGLSTTGTRHFARLFRDVCGIISPNFKDTLPGLTNAGQVAMLRGTDELYIDPGFFGGFPSIGSLILALWHTACHEIAHVRYIEHDEDFTIEEGGIARASADAILSAIGPLSRKYGDKLKKAGYCK